MAIFWYFHGTFWKNANNRFPLPHPGNLSPLPGQFQHPSPLTHSMSLKNCLRFFSKKIPMRALWIWRKVAQKNWYYVIGLISTFIKGRILTILRQVGILLFSFEKKSDHECSLFRKKKRFFFCHYYIDQIFTRKWNFRQKHTAARMAIFFWERCVFRKNRENNFATYPLTSFGTIYFWKKKLLEHCAFEISGEGTLLKIGGLGAGAVWVEA